MDQKKTESSFLEKNGQYFSYVISVIWLILIVTSVYHLKDGTYEKYFWLGPILLAVSTIASNAYYFKNINEKDNEKKKSVNVIYFHTILIPLYLTICALLFYIAKESPLTAFLLLR